MDKPTKITISSGKQGTLVNRLPSSIVADLNKHIQAEAYSSQIYLAMSAWCKDCGYEGGAKRFKNYAEEERMHMHKLYNFLLDRNFLPITPEIPKPKNDYKDILEVIETAYKHEIGVSDSYHVTAAMCLKENCYTTFSFIQWFIQEQIEEEAKFADLINQYNILMKTGISGTALYEFDEILGK
jgi:ferritin